MSTPLVSFQDVEKHFPVKRSLLEGLAGVKPKYVRAVVTMSRATPATKIMVVTMGSTGGPIHRAEASRSEVTAAIPDEVASAAPAPSSAASLSCR